MADDKENNKGGRPPMFKTLELLQESIQAYINDCPDTVSTVVGETVIKMKRPTITGLAYFLGFASRQSMYDYEKKDDRFSYTIKRARLWMEMQYEQMLQGKAPTGAIFALKNLGWKDKSEVAIEGDVPTAYTFIINGKEDNAG